MNGLTAARVQYEWEKRGKDILKKNATAINDDTFIVEQLLIVHYHSVYSSLLLLPGKTGLSCNSDFRILYTSRNFPYRKSKNKELR